MMATEALKLKAFATYMVVDSLKEVSEAIGVTQDQLAHWSADGEWKVKKQELMEEADRRIQMKLADISERIAQSSVDFASNIIEQLSQKFAFEIANAPVGSIKDLMSAVKDGIDAVEKLLSLIPRERPKEQSSQTKRVELTLEQKQKFLMLIDSELENVKDTVDESNVIEGEVINEHE